MSKENVKSILKKYNVWGRAAEDFLAMAKAGKGENFTVPEDRNALQYLKEQRPAFYQTLKLRLLPDPIYGNIDAPVCVVLINPGYSNIDLYNYCGVSEEVRKDVLDELGQKYRLEFLYNGAEEKRQLADRQRVLLEAYQMKPGALAYALDESFNTVRLTTAAGKKAAKRLGSYLWYQYFMGKVPSEKRNLVMDLEFFPYHSEHFDVRSWIRSEKEHPECRLAHSLLRDALIREFAAEGRILVARNSAIRDYMVQELQVPEKQICTFCSVQNAILSRNNLQGDPSTVQRIIELLELKK